MSVLKTIGWNALILGVLLASPISLFATARGAQPQLPAQTGLPPSAVATSPSTTQLPERFGKDVDTHITELHRMLEIKPSQEALFNAYAEAVRNGADTITAMLRQSSDTTNLTPPAQLRRYAQLLMAEAEALDQLLEPLDALYKSLLPAQKELIGKYLERLRRRGTSSAAQ